MRYEESAFAGAGGVRLFCRTWQPDRPAAANLVFLHGKAEHSGRHERTARYFVRHGIAFFAMDHRGFRHYLEDVGAFFAFLRGRLGGAPTVLGGHSTGGLIAYRYAQEHPDGIAGVVLASPFFDFGGAVPGWVNAVLPLAAALAPRLQINTQKRPDAINRDAVMVDSFVNDPLTVPTTTPRWTLEVRKGQQDAFRAAPRFRLPLLVQIGSADLIVSRAAAEAIVQQSGSPDKIFRVYDGFYHELYLDPEGEKPLGDVIAWMKERRFLQ